MLTIFGDLPQFLVELLSFVFIPKLTLFIIRLKIFIINRCFYVILNKLFDKNTCISPFLFRELIRTTV